MKKMENDAIIPTVELDNSRHTVWRFSYDGPPELPQALKGLCTYCCWFTSSQTNRVEGAVLFAHPRTIPLKRRWWKTPTQWDASTLRLVADWHYTMLVTHKEFGKAPPLLLKLLSDKELSGEQADNALDASQRYSSFMNEETLSSKKRKDPPPLTAEEQLYQDALYSLSKDDRNRIHYCSEKHFMFYYIRPAIERILSNRTNPQLITPSP